jgi:hypothetical protein
MPFHLHQRPPDTRKCLESPNPKSAKSEIRTAAVKRVLDERSQPHRSSLIAHRDRDPPKKQRTLDTTIPIDYTWLLRPDDGHLAETHQQYMELQNDRRNVM